MRPQRPRRLVGLLYRFRFAKVGVAAAAVLVALAVAAGAFLGLKEPGKPVAERPIQPVPLTSYSGLQPVPLTTFPGNEHHATLSPDGSQVAFSWNGENQQNDDIYVQMIGSANPLRLTMVTCV